MKHIRTALFLFCIFFITSEIIDEVGKFVQSGFDNHLSIEAMYRLIGFFILFVVLCQRGKFAEK
jgi:hypothetical protein